jgi:hypothetical protein
MSSDFLKLRLRAQEQEFSRQRDLNAYKTIRDSLKSTGQLDVLSLCSIYLRPTRARALHAWLMQKGIGMPWHSKLVGR